MLSCRQIDSYLPYYYHHPEYWNKIKEEAKLTHNMIASLNLFRESEKHHPLKEEEMIKIENIIGSVYCFGAKDDCLWDTSKYIKRMEERMKEKESKCDFHGYIYEHGTHFIFPTSFLRTAFPFADFLISLMFIDAKKYKKEGIFSRDDVEKKVDEAINKWLNQQ